MSRKRPSHCIESILLLQFQLLKHIVKDAYQTLKRLFQKLGLSEVESEMAMMAHVCPGLSPQQLGKHAE